VPDDIIAPAVLVEEEIDAEDVANVLATQPEDDDPLALVGEAADAPADTGRAEGVGP
jgi:hypothetical protein